MKKQEEKKKRLWLWLIGAVLVLGLAAGTGAFLSGHTFFNGKFYPRELTELDLRTGELTEAELKRARELFPEAHILQSIAIGDRIFEADDTDIVTGSFTSGDIGKFSRFYDLRSVDVSACPDPELTEALRAAYPSLRVFYSVPLGEETLSDDVRELTLSSAEVPAEELAGALKLLPLAETVTVSGVEYAPAEQLALQRDFPDVQFCWSVRLGDRAVDPDSAVLDLSGTPVTEETLAALTEAGPLLPGLETVELTDGGLSRERLCAFAGEHPEWTIRWRVELCGQEFYTDAEELTWEDAPMTAEEVAELEALLPAMRRLKKVNLLRCGIGDEEMDALNKRHPEVEFVWMVQLSSYGVRTDAEYFCAFNCEYEYDSVADTLFEGLKYCHNMVAVDLGHMHLYGDTSFFLEMPHLRYLIISNCAHDSIPELASLKELEFLELHKASTRDITQLKECTSLKHLNIVYKRVKSDEVAAADIETLTAMPWLERLYIGANMYRDEQIAALREALPNTRIEILSGENTVGQGWREDKSYFDMRDAMHMYYMDEDGNEAPVNPYTGEPTKYPDTDPFKKK